MIVMQATFDRSLNYTKIDRCQDNLSIDNDEYYRQIIHSNEHSYFDQDLKIKIILTNRFRLILFIFLILTSQANASPIYRPMNYIQPQGLSYVQPSPSSFPVSSAQLTGRSAYSQQSFKTYRRFPNAIQPIPSYSNAAFVQVHNQQQQQQPPIIVQNPNEQQFTLQIRRERQRRAMIDRMVSLFDDDGNGQLTKDEFYSMALRSNIFPKLHHYLKQAST